MEEHVPAVINLTYLWKKEREELGEKVIETIKGFGAEGIEYCMQCGACSSICPLATTGFEWYNRRLIKAIDFGIRDELFDDVTPWACVACNRCVEVCPRNVNPFEVMFAMRRLMIEELAVPMTAVQALKSLYDHGHAVYTTGREARKKVGLPEKPPTTDSDEKALEELRVLLRNTKLPELGLFPMS